MAADYELPVWAVRPNWDRSIVETLEWMSDVMTSPTGAEQRVGYRSAPRRLVEAHYMPLEEERAFVDLAFHRLGSNEWMMPLWFDQAELTANAVVGSSRIDFDTSYHEFVAGGMAYLDGGDQFSGEAVRIAAVDATGIDLVAPLAATWAAGSDIYSMRRGRFETPAMSAITSRVGDMTLRFEIILANELSDEGTWATTYGNFPVLSETPNWSDAMDINLSWLRQEFDPQIGLKTLYDSAARTFRQYQHHFMLSGPQAQWEFRQMLYRLAGRRGGIWIPTFADDMNVAAAAAIGAGSFDIEKIGLTYVGGPTEGRDHVLLPDGQITPISASANVGSNERLTLGSTLTGALAAGDRLSFIETCRLAQDSVEIEHIGNTDGLAVSALSFVAFSDRRSATTATQAIPAATMNSFTCGGPEADNTCAPAEWNPTFEGWLYEFRFVCDRQGDIYPLDFSGTVSNYGTIVLPFAFVHPNGGSYPGSPNYHSAGIDDEGGTGTLTRWIRTLNWPLESHNYQANFDADQDITPGNTLNDAIYYLYGRPWYQQSPVLLAQVTATSGFMWSTGAFQITL